jgi:ubiquinone/menaquinone biosynthesis C-methylase UbiE
MSSKQHTVPSFERAGAPFAYDLLVRTIYAPVGGESRLRRAAIAHLAILPGTRVLELGCGTGSFTQLFLECGADVTAMDGAHRMLVRAQRKAPSAAFARIDLRAFEAPAGARFDMVFFGFVLHELERPVRAALWREAVRCLAPNGRVVVVDHAVPQGAGLARAWRRFLLTLEPPTVRETITEGYETELRDAGLRVTDRIPLARGTAKLLVARGLG